MKLTILQWNIWYKEDIRNIAAFLREHRADVICLQELTRNLSSQSEADAPQFIANELGYNYHFEESVLDDEEFTQINGIFSRYPITTKRSHWVNEPTGTGHYDDEYRSYVEVDLNLGNSSVTIGTTHLTYTNAFVSTPRKEQETAKLVDILKTKKEKFIITGDFNAGPDSPTVQSVGSVLKNIGPDFNHKTWTTKPFSYDGFEEAELNWRLDYIFATKDVKTISAEVLKTEYSDHLPILAEVEV